MSTSLELSWIFRLSSERLYTKGVQVTCFTILGRNCSQQNSISYRACFMGGAGNIWRVQRCRLLIATWRNNLSALRRLWCAKPTGWLLIASCSNREQILVLSKNRLLRYLLAHAHLSRYSNQRLMFIAMSLSLLCGQSNQPQHANLKVMEPSKLSMVAANTASQSSEMHRLIQTLKGDKTMGDKRVRYAHEHPFLTDLPSELCAFNCSILCKNL